MPARYQPTAEESARAAEAMHWSGRSVREHLARMTEHFQNAEATLAEAQEQLAAGRDVFRTESVMCRAREIAGRYDEVLR